MFIMAGISLYILYLQAPVGENFKGVWKGIWRGGGICITMTELRMGIRKYLWKLGHPRPREVVKSFPD